MNRRGTLFALSALGAAPFSLRAQQARKLARIGYLGFSSAAAGVRYRDAFVAGLRDLGYVEGRNVHIEFRYADGDSERLGSLANELIGLNVDVIVAQATGVVAAHRATAKIPIVMATYADPVATGLAASLARPGRNVTGSTFFYMEIMAKRLELLKEIVPSMTRVGILTLRNNPVNGPALEAMRVTARTLKLELHPLEVSGPAEFEPAFSAWADKKIQGLVISDHSQFVSNAGAIVALASKRHLPSIGAPEISSSGGLMAYGVNFVDQYRRAAFFVDKILKGAKPGDIPIERATKFLYVLNLKTAKAFGITVPQSALLRADEVIE